MKDQLALLGHQMHFLLADLHVFGCVVNLLSDLLVSLVLIVNTDMSKSLSEVLAASVLLTNLKGLLVVSDVAHQEGL